MEGFVEASGFDHLALSYHLHMMLRLLSLSFLLLLHSCSFRAMAQAGCGNDSVVVTWVYGLNQAMGNYTYAVSTATYDLDSGIVETCTQLDFPPSPPNCNTGYWSRTDTTFDGSGRVVLLLTLTGSPTGWVNDRQTIRSYHPVYNQLVFEAKLQWNGSAWDSVEVTDRIVNGSGQVTETAVYDFSGSSRVPRTRELVTYIDGHPNDRTYQHGDLGNWANDSLYQFSYSGTIRTGLAYSTWDSGASNWVFQSLTPYLFQTDEWCAERKRYDDNVVSGIQTLDSVTWYVDTLEQTVYYHSFAWTDFNLSGSFFPTAYIKDFDSGYLRGELLLIHSAEGDYALEVISGDSTWFAVDRPVVTDYTYDTLNHYSYIESTGGCTNPCGSEFTYVIEPDGFQASQHFHQWTMTNDEDIYTIAERSPRNRPMLVAPIWEYDVPLCYNETYQPHITLAGGCAPYSVRWTPSNGLSNDTILDPVITVRAYQAYTLVVTDANGQTDTLQYSLSPVIDMSLQQPATVCDTLRTLELYNGAGLTTQWYWNSVPIPGATGMTYRADSAGEYYVMTTLIAPSQHFESKTCDNYSDTVLVIPHLPLLADAGLAQVSCAGDTLELGGAPTGSEGIGALFYLWTPATGLSSDTVANPTVVPLSVTTYTVQVTDEQGCTAAATAEVTVSPGFSVSLVQAGDSLLATAGAATYSWYRNDTLLASGTDPFYLPVVNGDYHVIATDSLGCEAISADFNFILTSVIGQSSAGSIRVYPNPAEQTATIDLGQSSGGFSLRVLDMTGRVCLQVMQEGSKAEVDLRGLVTGTYSVEIVAGGMHTVKRLLVAR